MATNALLLHTHPNKPFFLFTVLISDLISFVLYHYRSIFPECLIPNHLPAPHRGLNPISLMAPRRTARSTSLWWKAKQMPESVSFYTVVKILETDPKDS